MGIEVYQSGTNSKLLAIVDNLSTTIIPLVNIGCMYYTTINNRPTFEVTSNKTQNMFVVKIELTNKRTIEIPLGSDRQEITSNNVTNQPTWTNDLVGANAAINDIGIWIDSALN